jgi:hypothetical protein
MPNCIVRYLIMYALVVSTSRARAVEEEKAMLWLWGPIALGLGAVYVVSYILLRTAGDGRAWSVRLRHPNGG